MVLNPIKKTTNSLIYYSTRSVVFLYSRLFLNISITYLTKLPLGPKIFILNHPTTIDPFIALLLTKEKSYVLIWNTIFNIPVLGWFLRYLKHIPVNPHKGTAAYEESLKYLQQGKNIIVFPEGHLSRCDEAFSIAKSGCIRLAKETGAALIPVGVGLFVENIKKYPSQFNDELMDTSLYSGPYALTVGKQISYPKSINYEEIKYEQEILTQKMISLIELSRIKIAEIQRGLVLKRALNKAFSFTLYQIIFLIHFIR